MRGSISPWVRELTESIYGPSLAIGQSVMHPDGRQVRIIRGQFWGEFGLSNWWQWKEVLPNGSLAKTVESGYGWTP